MKKKCDPCAVLPALIFIALIAGISLWNILLPRKDFSEMENRSLAAFPPLSFEQIRSGKWMSEFDDYASDQFLFRDGFMKIKTAADLSLLRQDNGRVYFGKDGYLFPISQIDETQETAALKLVSDFAAKALERDPRLRLSVLLAPTAQSVLSDKLPPHAPVSDEPAALRRAADFLHAAVPGLIFTDPLAQLRSAASAPGGEDPAGEYGDEPADGEGQLYYRTDHHWTTDGAYLAYRQWAQDNGFTPASRDSFQRETVSHSFLGTNQAKAPGYTVLPDPIAVYTPKEPAGPCRITVWKDAADPAEIEIRDSFYDPAFLKTKDQYAYFLGGNDPQLRVETPVKNGRKLLLIKDSYANCMVPFLALHFEEIYITDLRYSHGKLLPAPGDGAGDAAGGVSPAAFTDVMFLYNIESFSSDKNLAYLTQLKLN